MAAGVKNRYGPVRGGSLQHVVLVLLVAAVTPAAASSSALSSAKSKMARQQAVVKPVVVLTGDSITEYGNESPHGWALQLAAAYTRRADVINRGFGGYNSRMAVHVLDEFLSAYGSRIKLATLGFGTNDAAVQTGKHGYLHVPLAEYRSNLETMIDKMRNKGVKDILVIIPPPVKGSTAASRAEVDKARKGLTKLSADVQMYAVTAEEVAQAKGVNYVDMYNAIINVKDWDTVCLQKDGVHLTPEGQKVMYDTVIKTIETKLPHVRPYALQMHMPSFDTIDPANPAKTFDSLYAKQAAEQASKNGSPTPPAPAQKPALAPEPELEPPPTPKPAPAPKPTPAKAEPAPAPAQTPSPTSARRAPEPAPVRPNPDAALKPEPASAKPEPAPAPAPKVAAVPPAPAKPAPLPVWEERPAAPTAKPAADPDAPPPAPAKSATSGGKLPVWEQP